MKKTSRTYLILKCLPKIGNIKALLIANNLEEDIEYADVFFKNYKIINKIEKNLPYLNLIDIENAIKIADHEIELSKANDIKILGYDDIEFPGNYREIREPPCILFVKGEVTRLNQKKKVAIIGSRDASDYAKTISKKIANLFNKNKILVVSGLASGCDEYAHKGSLYNGLTVAILPSGINNIYPKTNVGLASNILDNEGCLVSEYKLNTNATKYNFIARNRLQSALSKSIILIESKIDGGSMKTIQFAIEQGKKIYCWKHNKKYDCKDKCSGNHELLNDSKFFKLESSLDTQKMIAEDFKIKI